MEKENFNHGIRRKKEARREKTEKREGQSRDAQIGRLYFYVSARRNYFAIALLNSLATNAQNIQFISA